MILYWLKLIGVIFLIAWAVNMMTASRYDRPLSKQVATILDLIGVTLFIVGMILFKLL